MRLQSAREAWFSAYYQPWDSVMAGAMERAKLGIIESGMLQTRTSRDISTGRAEHQAIAAVIQKAIGTLPGYVASFGHWLYSPIADESHKEAAEAAVMVMAYDRHGRMTKAKSDRARFVAAGVLYRYRRMHQGGQSSMEDPYRSPESFRAWLLAEYGIALASEAWAREWGRFVNHCFNVCNDLDKQALGPVSSVIAEMTEDV